MRKGTCILYIFKHDKLWNMDKSNGHSGYTLSICRFEPLTMFNYSNIVHHGRSLLGEGQSV